MQLGRVELGAVHRTGAVDQVVRFVDQQAHAPCIGQRQAVQQRAGVEKVVVVADHHIAPTHQFLTKVVRADLVRDRDAAQGLAV